MIMRIYTISKIKFLLCLILILIVFSSCTSANNKIASRQGFNRERKMQKKYANKYKDKTIPYGKVYKGEASYYSDEFHGKKTASGEKFDMGDLTCAHKSLPFNTKLEITNLANGQKVVVRVNDRGPYKDGRVVDLSKAAAKKISLVKMGVAKVRAEVVK